MHATARRIQANPGIQLECMQASSFLWIDYETFGADPRVDRPAQFAALRTDTQFNVIDDKVAIYCKPADDFIPDPDACLITGIIPQICLEQGVPEVEFIRLIKTQMMVPGTCIVGYNNIRFDDEITRHILYRNLLDPYEHEWRNGNSRWDLIDVMRLMYALRPDGINWPLNEQGDPSFRLEQLTAANGIEHSGAHDALADVLATIELAKLVRTAQPKLYEYCLANRAKKAVFNLLDTVEMSAVVHVSSRYAASRSCLALVAPVAQHPVNKNAVIVYDLSRDPQPLLDLDVDSLRERLFSPASALAEGLERIAVKAVHANKCPILAPLKVLRTADAERLSIDREQCERNLKLLKQHRVLVDNKLQELFGSEPENMPTDPDLTLYSGGFFSDRDRGLMRQLHRLSIAELAEYSPEFEDQRLAELLFRLRARNYPESLSDVEQQRWNKFREERINNPVSKSLLSLSAFKEKLALHHQAELDADQLELLTKLSTYVDELLPD